MKKIYFALFCGLTFLVASCTKTDNKTPIASIDCDPITYQLNIKPLVETSCALGGCHSSETGRAITNYEQLKAYVDAGEIEERVLDKQTMPRTGSLTLCEHHMLPFFGKAHIAYIPNGYIVGLSKLPRVVDVFARRLQVQERLTDQILGSIQDTLNPLGVAVVIEAKHMCMMMRGVEKQNSVTTTSAFTGEFRKTETRTEFLKLISHSLH